MDLLLQLAWDGVANGSHYALLALGFGLIFDTTRIVHFAYGPIYALAAYLAWSLVDQAGLPLVPAALGATAATALIGLAAYLALYRPLERQGGRSYVLLAASLGLFMVAANLPGLLFGTNNKTLRGLDDTVFFLGDVAISLTQIAQVAALLAVALALFAFMRGTHYGRAIRALADNPAMARVVGVNVDGVTLLVFALGSAVSAVAAVLFLARNGAYPAMGFRAVFIAFVSVVIGGVGSLPGAAVAGLLLGLTESLGMWEIPSEWQSSIAFMVLFVVLLVRPTGLFRGR